MEASATGGSPRTGGSIAAVVALVACACLVGTASRGAEDCPAGNLLELDGVRVSLPAADARRLLEGRFEIEGTASTGRALTVDGPFVIDLGRPRTLRALLVQAEADDVYEIEGSPDGESWAPLALAGPTPGDGLRSRAIRLSRPVRIRRLRVVPAGPDGPWRLSGLAAWCVGPDAPPAVTDARAPAWRATARHVQLTIACLGGSLFLAGIVLRRFGLENRARRTRDGALAALGLLAALAWWNFGLLHPAGYVHTWEHFHYFLGGKYHDELGYTGLYECVTIADLEAGLESRVRARMIRDMTTNRPTSTAALLAHPERCTARFAPERWESFTRDVEWFRGKLHPALWEKVFLDHGYNAPPAWTLLGRALTSRLRASDGTMLFLALLDPLLLAAMWGAVLWAFGWRTCCVALLWWGTNQVANFSWVGGGLLRQDWLVLSVVGVCLVRRRWPLAGGLAIGYATALRIFPGLVVVSLGLQAAVASLRERRLAVTRAQLRVAAGFLAALAVLVPLAAAVSERPAPWREFLTNAKANMRAAGANRIGLMTTLTYDHEHRYETYARSSRPDAERRRIESARVRFAERRPLFWGLVAGFLLLLAAAVRRREESAALALGIGLIPVGVFVAGYYHAILLGYALLWKRLGDAVGLLLCALSVATHVAVRLWPAPAQMDTRFAWNSAATLVVVGALTALAALRPPPAARTEAG